MAEMRILKFPQTCPEVPPSKEDRWAVVAISLCVVLALISFGMAALA
jgi:hypothetical protein